MSVSLSSNFGYKVFKASIILGYIWRNLGYFGVFCRFFSGILVFHYPPWPLQALYSVLKEHDYVSVQVDTNEQKIAEDNPELIEIIRELRIQDDSS